MSFTVIPELCVGCTACIARCPVDCIGGTNKQIHFIDPRRCIDCGACGIVCPTSAISNTAGVVVPFIKKKRERPIAVVEETYCSGCDYCVDACPFGCLEIPKRAGVPLATSVVKMVAEKKCTACGLCAQICDKDAIAVRFGDGRVFDPHELKRATG